MSATDDEADLIVPHQAEIYVYANNSGGVTIRSVDHMDMEQIVAFQPAFAEPLIAAIRSAVEQATALVDDPAPAPSQALINQAFAAATPDASSKVVLVTLAFHADASLRVTFSNERLAAVTGLGTAAVADVISNLEDGFWLSTCGPGETDPAAPQTYLLTPEAWV